jgi:hypothetical protein
MGFATTVFENYNVIFIGYGLREYEILQGITNSKNKKRHYWLEQSFRKREDYLKIRATNLRENYNITLIPYFIDMNGHEVLYKVLDELYKVIESKLRK